MLAREFFSRCDLQEDYMSLDKCAETFGITPKIAKGIYAYIRMNEALDDAPFNHARKIQAQQQICNGRGSVVEDLQEWSRVYGKQNNDLKRAENDAVAQLPSLFLTFENFVEASVYVSPRASIQQRIDLAFSILDANCDGFVDASEIRSIMLDSLRTNLSNHKGESSKKVIEILENEVEELIDDLRSQYRADEFTKGQFIEFAESAEFLNFFTVNKHWLRDILGDNNYNKQARPQDAEMRQFLESVREEEKCDLDSEDIVDLQETLRDHLVDSINDLRTIKLKDFLKMNISRKTAKAIISRLHHLNSDLEETDYVRIPSALPGASRSSSVKSQMSYKPSTRQSLEMSVNDSMCCAQPSTSTTIQCAFISIYALQILLSYCILSHNDAATVIGRMSAHGLFLCIFVAPLARYYSLLTKWMSIFPNTLRAELVLFITSTHCAKINAIFAICYVLAHGLALQIKQAMASSTVSWQASTGWVLLALGILSLIDWWRVMNPHALIHQFKSAIIWVVVVSVIVLHTVFTSSSINIWSALPLSISLLPTAVLIVASIYQRIANTRTMEVELVKNERPNYMLFWIRRGNFSHRCGQYVLLNYPSVSKHEYHPFYITSSPDSSFMRISMLSCGDWTQRMFDLHMQQMEEVHRINVLGPFGSGFSANKVDYNYDNLMVIAAGEGSVEVISSFLDFCCNVLLSSRSHPVKKLYVYWMVSADDGCYWFYKLLRDLRNMHKDMFFPTIFVTSSTKGCKVSSFGLNFFLALRRESLQANVMARRTVHRLSTDSLSSFRARKKSIFHTMREFQNSAVRRASRFHGGANNLLMPDDDSSSSHLLPAVDRKQHKSSSRSPSPGGRGQKNHGFNLKFESQVGEDSDDICMQSPDFRNTFSRIREQLIHNHDKYGKPAVGQGPYNVQKQCSMNSIVPNSLCQSGRKFNVGTFFVGSEILANRLSLYCEQFTDDQVEFDFKPMVIGKNYTNKYSDS